MSKAGTAARMMQINHTIRVAETEKAANSRLNDKVNGGSDSDGAHRLLVSGLLCMPAMRIS